LGDTANVMDDGRVIWSGAMEALANDAPLQEQLMGLSMEAHST
jgi:branched-chain amino acid transport system ATP-binding protein